MAFYKKRKGDDEEKIFLMNLNHSQNDSTQMLNKEGPSGLLTKKKKDVNKNNESSKKNNSSFGMSERKEASDIKSESRKIVEDDNSFRDNKSGMLKEESKYESQFKEQSCDNKSKHSISKNNSKFIQDVSSEKSHHDDNNNKDNTIISNKKEGNDETSQHEDDSNTESNTLSDDNNDDNNDKNKPHDFEPSFSDESIDQAERHYRQLLKTERIVSIYMYIISI